jgi:hypothetical protein
MQNEKPQTTRPKSMLKRLMLLRDHIQRLDSESGDAMTLIWAVRTIEHAAIAADKLSYLKEIIYETV